jgi:hypothetical protein
MNKGFIVDNISRFTYQDLIKENYNLESFINENKQKLIYEDQSFKKTVKKTV